MKRRPIQKRLQEYTQRLVETYRDGYPNAHNLDHQKRLPSQEKVIEIIEQLFEAIYPGYYGNQHLTRENVAYHVGALLDDIADELDQQIFHALRFMAESPAPREEWVRTASEAVEQFIASLPEIRELLRLDVEAAYDGDPAAKGFPEIILAYPGLEAITIHRLAHRLHGIGVPLIPRIMAEHAHRRTGIDIHPGARIGRSFFIDHGTGVVIGETTEIGDRVKIYQGVTLGALSFPKDERGKVIRGHKRHPTLEDDVVIYAGATILGGETVIGRGSIIGGNMWVTQSIPPNSKVIRSTP